MGGMVIVLDRLLAQADTNNESVEHVIEQAHYAVEDVHKKFLVRFEQLIEEISESLGPPEYNASTNADDGGTKNPMPKWVTGSRHGEAASKVLRLCYWKREEGISYLILRMQMDSKDRPTYYDLVLGARRRVRGQPVRVDKMRNHDDTSFVGWIKRILASKTEA